MERPEVKILSGGMGRASKWDPFGVKDSRVLSVFGGPVETPRIDEKESFL